MCELYVNFGSTVRSITFGCVSMDSAVLFILRSILLLYSTMSGVNIVQVVYLDLVCDYYILSYVGMVVCIYFFTRDCVCRCNGDLIRKGHNLNRCSGWW